MNPCSGTSQSASVPVPDLSRACIEGTMAGPLNRSQIADLVDRITELLADPDANLSPSTRTRWEGALTALAFVLGNLDRLPLEDPDRFGL